MNEVLEYNDVFELRNIIKLLNEKLEILEKSKKAICEMVLKDKEVLCCPKCHSVNINKNGKYKERQTYICKDCNKKFNNLTGTIFHHTHLTYKQVEIIFDCTINLFSIRKTASKVGVSTKTAFTIRHKIMSCLKDIVNSFNLSGEIELDEYYLSINLKGTRKANMIKETVVPRIIKAKKIITDCKSSYEEVAKEKHWNLKQIKSGTYTNNENNNLANINSLHQQLTIYLSNFIGVSTKHLQEYLNLFSFLKYLNWTTDYSN